LVEAAIRDTQAPNKILDRMDMFLVRLGGENNRRAPRPEALSDPSVSLQNLELFHDYVALMGLVVRLLTTNRRRSAGGNGKFEI
jgi:hypothetical protein